MTPLTLQFTRAGAENADEIYALLDAVRRCGKADGSCLWDDDYPRPDNVTEDLASGEVWVAREPGNDAILAAVTLLPEDEFFDFPELDWREHNACTMARLCVDPAHQHHGIAAFMMDEINDRARALGFAAAHHLAYCDNDVTTRLYARLGYRNVGKIHAYDSDFYGFERIL